MACTDANAVQIPRTTWLQLLAYSLDLSVFRSSYVLAEDVEGQSRHKDVIALDAIHRAVTAARHAEQLCDRASQQFRQGCGVARGLPRNRADRRHEQLDISMSRASHEFREAWWHQQKDHAAIRSPSQRSPPLDTEHRASGPHRLTMRSPPLVAPAVLTA